MFLPRNLIDHDNTMFRAYINGNVHIISLTKSGLYVIMFVTVIFREVFSWNSRLIQAYGVLCSEFLP